MRAQLPVLPLRNTVLLPGMIARVQVSRPLAVAAIERHLSTGQPLLVVAQVDPLEEDLAVAELTSVATLSTALKSVRLGDGTIRVLLEGAERRSIQQLHDGPEGGLVAQGRHLPDRVQDPEQARLLARKLRDTVRTLFEGREGDPPALARVADLDVPPGRLADHAAANLTVPHADRLHYLVDPIVDQRLARALIDVGREIALRSITHEVDAAVQRKLDKQQREYFVREQIKGLRAELGEAAESHDDADQLEARLREAGLPEEAMEEALRELGRLRRMHPDASEYHVARTWLEWLANMPWAKASEDSQDIHQARRVLDADHHGLDKVKDRILEYLAVRILKPDGKGPVLCLLGPPGVGKTSLGRSIAKALGREFQRVSLGGMKDEAEIRGHRRTYVGALPGRLAHALKKAGTRNPVIVLDEIDKLGKDFRGDPAAALLEVLDPEQNHAFVDHYLDVPLDLSQVLFVCTANQAGPIPSALRDRLEITEIPGYLEEEKLEIARRHLLPRLQEGHGLVDGQLSITRKAVRHVVRAYTREAGVRGLEQRLAGLNRKAARAFVEGRRRPMRIDRPDQVRKLLGPPRHFPELAERADQPGIAIGLAWTEAGGDILFIEAATWPGTGEGLKLTGQLGQVMKESVETALSLVRSRATDWGVDPAVFKDATLHVHVPAGAIPKDGPSAGITMVTAILGLLTGRLARPALAMTGEITLRGKVLPVGGIKEKVLAARRAGVEQVILPRRNETDLEDVPPALLRDLEVHLVDHIDEVLALTLLPPT
jgi:ATP-dependent Lon protease